MPSLARAYLREARSTQERKSAQSKASCWGIVQTVSATLWLTALAVSFTVTLGGLAGVEECLRRETSPPPPPRPPPPPSPHPPSHHAYTYSSCETYCRLFSLNDGRCNPRCNTRACNYDGGDCHAGSTVSSHTMPGGSSSSSAHGAVTAPATHRVPPTTIQKQPQRTWADLVREAFERQRQRNSAAAAAAGRDRRQMPTLTLRDGRPVLVDDDESYSYDSYSYDEDDDDDDDDDEDDEDDDDDRMMVGHATDVVITPLLSLVGTFGGLGAIASLVAGLLAVCGAASSHTAVLRASACLSAVTSLGGLLLAVGAFVVGGMLVSGGELFGKIVHHEFPAQTERCILPIVHYAWYVGISLLALAATCTLAAIAAIVTLDAACKAASVTAASGPAEGTEELSLISTVTPGGPGSAPRRLPGAGGAGAGGSRSSRALRSGARTSSMGGVSLGELPPTKEDDGAAERSIFPPSGPVGGAADGTRGATEDALLGLERGLAMGTVPMPPPPPTVPRPKPPPPPPESEPPAVPTLQQPPPPFGGTPGGGGDAAFVDALRLAAETPSKNDA